MRKLLIVCLLIGCCTALFAKETIKSNTLFPTQKANAQLDNMIDQLTSGQLYYVEQLEDKINTLVTLQTQAKTCVDNAQSELDTLGQRTEPTNTEATTDEKRSDLQAYLANKRADLERWHSECQLFVLRSNETITAFNQAEQKLSTQELLHLNPHFLQRLQLHLPLLAQSFSQLDGKRFITRSGILHTLKILPLSLLIILLIICFGLSTVFKKRISTALSSISVETFSQRFMYTLLSAIQQQCTRFNVALALSVGTGIVSWQQQTLSYIFLASTSWLLYIVLSTILHTFFFPYYGEKTISGMQKTHAASLMRRCKLLVMLCLFGFVLYYIAQDQHVARPIVEIARTLFITLLSFSIMATIWSISRLPHILNAHAGLRLLTNTVLTSALTVIILAEWLGYQNLVTYLLQGIILTTIASLLAWTIHRLATRGLRNIAYHPSRICSFIRHQLGLKRERIVPEMMYLGIIVYILVWGGLLTALLKIWGISDTYYRTLTHAIANGFTMMHANIMPARIFYAFLTFTLMLILVRWIKTRVEHRGISNQQEYGTYKALGSITSYIGFSIALITALLTAGVNFAGLAIIAGALSVGIGFGLQTIVNNFVSGLILLIERPIKPGDRVVIDGVEGYVEKIRIRSTQIRTRLFSDLIVPNADLISKTVTNLMFRDFYNRVKIEIGVDYGSDVPLIKKILHEVASNHPEIIKNDSTNKISVYLLSFGESSLNFVLRCVMRNVNLKDTVTSDLHCGILEAFDKHGIRIAYPHRVIEMHDKTAI